MKDGIETSDNSEKSKEILHSDFTVRDHFTKFTMEEIQKTYKFQKEKNRLDILF